MGTDPPATALTRLRSITWETDQVRTFELRRVDGAPLPAWEPGAHIDLHLPNGLVRQYSLLPPAPGTAARADSYRIGVKREPDSSGGSRWLFSRGQVGLELEVSAPRNNFPLPAEHAGPVVLIAGGIGITPLLAMADELARRTADWRLHVAVRTRAELAFAAELAGHGDRARLHVDDEAGCLLDLAAVVADAPTGAHLCCCGPNPMLASFVDACAAAGVNEERVHVERFSAVAPPATGGGYTVVLSRRGTRVDIPAGATILGTLRKLGLSVMASCERGICGTCETAVLDGIPDHRDTLLSPEEKEDGASMMICCSGSLSPELVLDL